MSDIENIKDLDKQTYIDFINSVGKYIIGENDQVTVFPTYVQNTIVMEIFSSNKRISHRFEFKDLMCIWYNEKFGGKIDLTAHWIHYRANQNLLCRLVAERWNEQVRKEMRTLQKKMITKNTMDKLHYITTENEIE